MAPNQSPWTSWGATLLCALAFFSTLPLRAYADNSNTIVGTNAAGVTQYLADDRTPALYTGEFGDCMGGQSLINVTAFDAAYYADNMTVLFHLSGMTNLRNDSVMRKFRT